MNDSIFSKSLNSSGWKQVSMLKITKKYERKYLFKEFEQHRVEES
jgi:hypothetical protein